MVLVQLFTALQGQLVSDVVLEHIADIGDGFPTDPPGRDNFDVVEPAIAVIAVFLCFLPILIVYYPFLMYTIDASKNGSVPPLSVWSGNLVLALWGAYLLRKVLRY